MDPESTRVIHRDLDRIYPTLVRGEGIYLYDDEGKRYIDGSGGSAAVTAIGHGVPEVVNALADQAARLAYAPTHAFTTERPWRAALASSSRSTHPMGSARSGLSLEGRRRPTTR